MSSWLKIDGTQTGNFGLGLSGVQLQNNNGNLEVRTNNGASLSNIVVASANITGTLSAANLSISGNIGGDGSELSNINAANVVGEVANAAYANIAGSANSVAVANVSGIGNIAVVNLSGNGSQTLLGNGAWGESGSVANAQYANFAGVANSVAGANVTGTVANATFATTAGTANAVAGANVSGQVSFAATANSIAGANVSGAVANANFASNSDIAAVVSGNAQPNITSVGTLTELVVSGNATVTGDLSVIGNLTYNNVDNLYVVDPIIEQGGGPNGAPLTSNDGMDRGSLLHYYTTQPVDAFMGWDTGNGEFAFGSNVTAANNVMTFNNYGNVRALNFIGNLSGVANSALVANAANSVAGANVSGAVNVANYATAANSVAGANVSGEVDFAATANSIAGANVTGEVAFAATANSVAGANVSGTVSLANAATTAGTVTTNSQPNITSVGTLSSLTVSGTANANTVSTHLLSVAANANIGGELNVTGNVLLLSDLQVNGNINFTGNVTQISGNSGQFFGDANGVGALYAGIPVGFSPVPNAVIQATASVNSYAQINFQNLNGGNVSSTEYAATADNGDDSTNYIDVGIAGGSWDGTQENSVGTAAYADDGWVFVQGGTGGGNLVLGTTSASTNIKFLVGGGNLANVRATLSSTGLNVTGNITTGNINGGNLVSANFLSGDGYLISNLSVGAGSEIENGNSNVAVAANANVVVNVAGNSAIATFTGNGAIIPNITVNGTISNGTTNSFVNFGSNIKVGGGGRILSPGGASSITLDNNGFSFPQANGTTINVVTANATGNLNVTGNAAFSGANVSLGEVGNLRITGGSNGQYLQTNGSGALTWASLSSSTIFNGSSNVTIPSANGAIQVYVDGNSRLEINGTGANVTGDFGASGVIGGNGSGLTQVTGANVTGFVANANVANTAYSVAVANVSGIGNIAVVNLSGNGSQTLLGNGAWGESGSVANAQYANIAGEAYSVAGANVTGEVDFAATANSVAGANVTGEVAFADTANSVAGANVTGEVANAAYATTAGSADSVAVANVTGIGNIATLNLDGDASKVLYGNGVFAVPTIGGTSIANGNSNVSVLSNSNVTINITGTSNIVTVSTDGMVVTGIVSANTLSGEGGNISNVTAVKAGTVTTNAQPNITSVGTLTSLSVSGDATITGNLSVTGNTNFTNTDNLYVTNPLIEQGGGANGAPLTTNDGLDRGSLLHYYTTQPIDAFMGWDNGNGEFSFGSNVTNANGVITFNTLGNVRANVFIGQLTGNVTGNVSGNVTGTLTGNVGGGNLVSANYITGTLTTAAQASITSVGTLTGLDVNAVVTATGFTANTGIFTGNGAGLTNINASNISGTIANATYAVTAGGAQVATSAAIADVVSNAAQPNITSVGTLTSLTVSGTSNLGPVGNVTITGGTNGQVLTTNGSNVLSWTTVSGGGGTANALNADIANVIINGGSNGYVLSTNGSGNLSWVAQSGGGGADFSGSLMLGGM